MIKFRSRFFGFGVGGRGGVVVDGGAVSTFEFGGGGVSGTFWDGIVELEDGVAGVGDGPANLEVGVVAPGAGGGSEVLELADPGRTIGFESVTLGFLASAKPL